MIFQKCIVAVVIKTNIIAYHEITCDVINMFEDRKDIGVNYKCDLISIYD